MLIQVTQTDIDNGTPRSACYCPIAQSIKRADKNRYNVAVVYDFATYNEVGVPKAFKVRLPLSAQSFISCVDDGKPVEPFEFETEEPYYA